MRSTKLLFSICVAGILISGAVEAQTDKKKEATGSNFVAPRSTVVAPQKPAPAKMAPASQTNKAPRPTFNAPLSEAECKGLGGKVESGVLGCAMSGGGGKQCVTVDQNGVVRRKCLSR